MIVVARQDRVRRRADDDGAWKRVLGELLREFVAFALPELHLAVDWDRAPVFLEQELRPILRQAALGRRVGDLVAQLWLANGATQWLLIHVEVQDRHEADFAERMYTYAALLHLHYRVRPARSRAARSATAPPPASMIGVALLTDADADWQPGPYHWGWGEYGIYYRYRVVKLANWRERSGDLVNDAAPFSWAIRIWLAVQAAGRTIEAQAVVRREVGRQLLAARRQGRLTDAQAVALYLFLDAVNRLPDVLSEAIDRELQLNEEELMTKLLTRWERQGLQRGLERGLEQGLERGQIVGAGMVVFHLLAKKRIPLDPAAEERIRGLDREQLLALTDVLLDLQSRADLDTWLAQQAPQGR